MNIKLTENTFLVAVKCKIGFALPRPEMGSQTKPIFSALEAYQMSRSYFTHNSSTGNSFGVQKPVCDI